MERENECSFPYSSGRNRQSLKRHRFQNDIFTDAKSTFTPIKKEYKPTLSRDAQIAMVQRKDLEHLNILFNR